MQADVKQRIRRDVLERLRSLDPVSVREESWAACGHLRASGLLTQQMMDGGVVAGYFPLPIARGAEADPWPVLLGCTRLGLPRTKWHPKRFDICLVPRGNWREQMRQGRHGLTEPPESWPAVDPTKIAAVLVPGVAFDRDGHRLGRGAGLYDRFLEEVRPETPTIGLALRAQIVDRVPVESHDVPVRAVVTPDGVLKPS